MSEYDAWAPVYDAWAAHMTEDVAHYVELAREADGPIVELMVGSGRVAIEVVRATGKPVLGIDSSPAMLALARDPRIAVELDGTTQNQNGIVHTTRYFAADNRVEISRDDGATIRLWWATKAEWEGLIDVAGLEVEALYGWFDRRPFDDAATEYVWVTRKPARTTR